MARRRRHRRHHRRHNPLAVRAVNPISHGEELLLTGVILAAAAGGVYWYLKRYTYTLANGSMSIAMPSTKMATFNLPSGGTWTSLISAGGGGLNLNLNQTSGSQSFTPSSPGTYVLNATWTLNGAAQNTTITITAS